MNNSGSSMIKVSSLTTSLPLAGLICSSLGVQPARVLTSMINVVAITDVDGGAGDATTVGCGDNQDTLAPGAHRIADSTN